MDEFNLIKEKLLRGECRIAEAESIIRKLKETAQFVRHLHYATTQFLRLQKTSTRLEKCRDFTNYCLDENNSIWEGMSKLRRDALLFLAVSFTPGQLKAADLKLSDVELYVEAHPVLNNHENQGLVEGRLIHYLNKHNGEKPELFRKLICTGAPPNGTDTRATESISGIEGESCERPYPTCSRH